MLILFSIISALFAGITTILSKIGTKNIDIYFALLLKTIVVFFLCFFIILFEGELNQILLINKTTIIFLFLSGITTTLLWICYLKALNLGEVSKVSSVDKLSIVITLIFSFLFLNEQITIIKIISIFLITLGSILMTYKSKVDFNNKWYLYAFLTALFNSLTTILSKIGIQNINPDIGALIKTFFVVLLLIIILIFNKKSIKKKERDKKSILLTLISGITTGIAWFFYFKALKIGDASIVFSLEKLSIIVVFIFSIIIFKEKINVRSIFAIIIILIGNFLLI